MVILNDIFQHQNYLNIFNDRNDTILLSNYSYQIGMAFRIRNYDIDDADCTCQIDLPNEQNKHKWFTFLELVTAKHNSGQSMLIDSIRDSEGDYSRLGSSTFSADIPSRVIGQPNLIEYFANEKDLQRGKRTQTKIGKYIRQRFDNMSDETVADFANVYTDNNYPLEIRFTCSAEKIVEIYGRQSMRSCMTKGAEISHKVDGVLMHPCAIYGDTGFADIFLAYGVRGSKINSRSLINMQAKKFNTVYGDKSLKRGLLAAGFSRGDLTDCRLRKFKTDDNEWLMVYLDGENRLRDDGDYFTITSDDETATEQASGIDGISETYYSETNYDYYCADCDEGMSEEDSRQTHEGNMICESCCSNNYYLSDFSENYVHCDDSTYISIINSNGDFEHDYYLHSDDYETFMEQGYVYIEIYDGTMSADDFQRYSEEERASNE